MYSSVLPLSVLATFLFSSPLVLSKAIFVPRALGINCRGSLLCTGATGVTENLASHIQQLDDAAILPDGYQIACQNTPDSLVGYAGAIAYCAFFQGRNGTGADAKLLMAKLTEHKCAGCGSAPYLWETNDPSRGILTVNAVDSFCAPVTEDEDEDGRGAEDDAPHGTLCGPGY